MKLQALYCSGKSTASGARLPGFTFWPLLTSSVTLGKFFNLQTTVSGHIIGELHISLLFLAVLKSFPKLWLELFPQQTLTESTGRRCDCGQSMGSAEKRLTRIYLGCRSSCQGRFHAAFMKSQSVAVCKPIEPQVQTRHSLKFQERDHIELPVVSRGLSVVLHTARPLASQAGRWTASFRCPEMCEEELVVGHTLTKSNIALRSLKFPFPQYPHHSLTCSGYKRRTW